MVDIERLLGRRLFPYAEPHPANRLYSSLSVRVKADCRSWIYQELRQAVRSPGMSPLWLELSDTWLSVPREFLSEQLREPSYAATYPWS